MGYFCDSYQGGVFLVANTNSFHLEEFQSFKERFEAHDEPEEPFRWQIGNWKYPDGLVADDFRATWDKFRAGFWEATRSGTAGPFDQVRLEYMAAIVLKRLVGEGAFVKASASEGFNIQGPDDPHDESVLVKKRMFDDLVRRSRGRASGM